MALVIRIPLLARCFAIVPALFMMAIAGLRGLNVMGLRSPHPAILSALICNAPGSGGSNKGLSNPEHLAPDGPGETAVVSRTVSS